MTCDKFITEKKRDHEKSGEKCSMTKRTSVIHMLSANVAVTKGGDVQVCYGVKKCENKSVKISSHLAGDATNL